GCAARYVSSRFELKEPSDIGRVHLAIIGRIGLCWSVIPTKQPGSAASITRWTAFQNDSMSIVPCRLSRGFSTTESMIVSRLSSALDIRFIIACPPELPSRFLSDDAKGNLSYPRHRAGLVRK